ncbi:MAG: LysR family transcriptional regulator [Rhizobiales bacterium]|nr:LysR family transcriptional regulator [Hyphomicrobiales bacterium]
MLDRFTGMQVLSRVAALGSFSAAARALGLSQTMVTRHVDAIEDRIGARLFHRSTRRLTLTEAGQDYLAAAERILAEVEEAESAAAAEASEPRGTLRLNLPLAFGVREAVPAIAAFAVQYPALTIDIGLNDRVIDLLEEGWDMALRIGSLRDSSLVARRLAPIRTVLCASPAYLAARGTPRTVAELAGHDCLGYTLPTPAAAERWRFGHDGRIEVPVSGTFRANNGDALRSAALAGIGITYQPTFLFSEDLREGRLVPLVLDHPAYQYAAAYAVHAPGRHVPAKVRRVIDFLVARWAGVPPWDAGLPPEVVG